MAGLCTTARDGWTGTGTAAWGRAHTALRTTWNCQTESVLLHRRHAVYTTFGGGQWRSGTSCEGRARTHQA